MKSEIQSHRDLRVWQRAYELGLAVYRSTASFPKHEQFSLTTQLRRSAVSVPSNIAEGYGRGSRIEYARFLKIARGSLFELETQLSFARDLHYLDQPAVTELSGMVIDVSKMLTGLINKLRNSKPDLD